MYTLAIWLILIQLCSASTTRGRVVGGRKSSMRYRRSVLLLFRRDDSGGGGGDGLARKHCTATVLGPRHALTAAHCVVGFHRARLGVVPGTYDVGEGSKLPLQELGLRAIRVKKAYVHASYGDFTQADRRYDIAVLVLARRLPHERGAGLQAVKLGDVRARSTPRRVIAAGFGAAGELKKEVGVLNTGVVVARSFQWCIKHEKMKSKRSELSKRTQFCATSVRYPKGITDTCYGDSGGPLFEIDEDAGEAEVLTQIGVTSFSFGKCAQPGSTPWYIRISAFRDVFIRLIRHGRYNGTFIKLVSTKKSDFVLEQIPNDDGVDTQDLDPQFLQNNDDDDDGEEEVDDKLLPKIDSNGDKKPKQSSPTPSPSPPRKQIATMQNPLQQLLGGLNLTQSLSLFN